MKLYAQEKWEIPMSSFREYNIDRKSVSDWLPWGGLTREDILENKDNSLVGFIRYAPYPTAQPVANIEDLPRGWGLTAECQHGLDGTEQNVLIVLWNPFIRSGMITNTIEHKKIRPKENKDYFRKQLYLLRDKINASTKAEVLTYQDILDVLSFALDFGLHPVKLPDVPLYLDALLPQDVDLRFPPNDITIDGQRILVVSLMGGPHILPILSVIASMPYRYIRRLLCMNEKQAKKDVATYSDGWCDGRKYVHHAIFDDILAGSLHGYYEEYFVFLLDEKNDAPFRQFLGDFLTKKGVCFRFESYNAKDMWWGSLPGIFRADVEPPAVGVKDFDALLLHSDEPKKEDKLEESAKNLVTTVHIGEGGEALVSN